MNSFFKRINTRQLIILGLSIPALLLILVEWLQWQSWREYRVAFELVNHTRIVLLNLESLLSSMNDAETGERGYLLTHQEKYLEPYERALNESRDQIRTLRQLTSDNAVQQKSLDHLEPLVNARFNEMAQTVMLEKKLDHKGAINMVTNDLGKNSMDQIRAILGDMHDVEKDLLQQREKVYEANVWKNSELSGLVIAAGLGFIVFIFFLLRRLERMQQMIKICSWSKLIEYEGEWLSIEDYLTRRFKVQITHGMSDAEAKKFLALINEENPEKVA